ncbi:MAG: LPS export ABC transporter periplasmic protein LptC [Deltaproteobacteria bacterium]|jgi:LPS export ABC transporter protein LptC|nr:LPS export ABC transporter periplasmic protein LptC [Deltaproteobacteria bacterium]
MKVFRARNLLLLLALVIAIILAATIYMRQQPEKAIDIAKQVLPEGVDLSLKGLDYTHIESGTRRWHLTATRVEHQATTEQLVLHNPQLDFFDEHGVALGNLRAEKGLVSEDYQQIVATGKVVLEDDRGYTFVTSTLKYDHDQTAFETEDPIKLTGERIVITGRGLRMDLTSRHLEIKADVKATIVPEDHR